jgi:deoxyribodipyrimidine photo-lyase
VLTNEGKTYSVFSQFFKKASQKEISLPEMTEGGKFYSGNLSVAQVSLSDFSIDRNLSLFTKGGRIQALSVLQKIREFRNYENERDFPSVTGTTGLSAHNKLGTISIREFYHYVENELGRDHTLINELHWRDFFTHIAVAYPYVFKGAFKKKFDSLSWSNDEKLFDAWCRGQTGFPIVDAGMRELITTGYMHNRVRMIVSSFLVKDLHIDWKWGERYFASQLVDYDPCVNNGNWQWAASTGADSQPYFRIFNPWLQQKKFDPDCLYIKKWILELEGLSPKVIHSMDKGQQLLGVDYPQPIVDHSKERNVALEAFKLIG